MHQLSTALEVLVTTLLYTWSALAHRCIPIGRQPIAKHVPVWLHCAPWHFAAIDLCHDFFSMELWPNSGIVRPGPHNLNCKGGDLIASGLKDIMSGTAYSDCQLEIEKYYCGMWVATNSPALLMGQ